MTVIPHIQQQMHTIYIKSHHPHTWAVLHVSAINQHPQGDINTKYKIIYTMLQINNGCYTYKLCDAGILLNKINWCATIYCISYVVICIEISSSKVFDPKKIKSLYNTLLHETHKYTGQGPVPFGAKTSIPDVSICLTVHSGTSVSFI